MLPLSNNAFGCQECAPIWRKTLRLKDQYAYPLSSPRNANEERGNNDLATSNLSLRSFKRGSEFQLVPTPAIDGLALFNRVVRLLVENGAWCF